MILLDDAQSTAANPSSRLYENPIRYWCLLPSGDANQDRQEISRCLAEIAEALGDGQYLVSAFAYELGRSIHHLSQRPLEGKHHHPLIEAWSFQDFKRLSKAEVDALIAQELEKLEPPHRDAGVLDLEESITAAQFTRDLEAIAEYIRAGDTYQINHTYRICGQTYGAPLALYARLRNRQPGRYGAFIAHQSRYLLSQSPELFIERHGDLLTAMPMKGTASALAQSASALSDDPKNQAENVMIVDLLRNDLSRISLPNSVTVPSLFSVARHGDVLQMTSTVQGKIKPKVGLEEILNAIFPCGSVTGAPKKRSMEIIQELEPMNRGYYCGALGWLDPDGDFALSVPIRTVEIEEDLHTSESFFTLGIGAGITIDSNASEEWEECQIKSAFLIDLPSATGLFETIAIHMGLPQRVEQHLHRMASSATALRIPFDPSSALSCVLAACSTLDANADYRLRLDLSPSGELTTSTGALHAVHEPVEIFWAKDILPMNCTMHSGDPLLRHKVTTRSIYDLAWQTATERGGFDALFTNEQGFVTEGGRTSIFILPKGSSEWLTPPLSAGLLPGVMRAALLADPQMNAREANLTISDVTNAQEIMLSNALRGAMKAFFRKTA
ncbi:chorismate-binding protein [Polynucleobacter sp. UK-Kesae-W10]|uniref:chorismate-binding protein n=1 Tax=Polynucleobacter sp. UK-Kesae-W10 TaxID=1819738 RepID=UPI001C0B6669|nr:chorismate-binding protein [Polynucleobacter sp. UK-Kesae-W10]MBU3577368.1 chorismate-binding protein [Polynucleobacter sp. UK-Kesae-W10]